MMNEALLTLILITSRPVEVVTTGYCWHYPCVNRGHEHGITASGSKVERGVCAAAWSVFPRGSVFYVPGYGLCRVEDTGRLVNGKHIDLYFDRIEDAIAWGRKTITVWRVPVETQETIGKWATENFGRPSPFAVVRRSVDELLEALEVCVKENAATTTMFKAMRLGLECMEKYAHPDDVLFKLTPEIAKEIADSMVVNYHAATVMHVDIHSFIDQKMDVNRRRKWKRNADGTGQHIDEPNVDEDVVLDSLTAEEESHG